MPGVSAWFADAKPGGVVLGWKRNQLPAGPGTLFTVLLLRLFHRPTSSRLGFEQGTGGFAKLRLLGLEGNEIDDFSHVLALSTLQKWA